MNTSKKIIMNTQNFEDVPMMWKPKEENGKLLKKLMSHIEDKYQIKLAGYWDLHDWSVNHLCEFWTEIWDFFGFISSKKFHRVINLSIPMSEGPKWFEGAELNYAENLLRYRDDHVALIVAGEDRETETVTYKQMYDEAKLYAAAFRKFGLKKGDVAVCFMSNRKEAFFAMQATTSIGAIWTGALPLLGAQAVLSRFQQVSPKILITVDRFPNQGKEIEMLPKVKEIVDGLPSLEKVLIVASKPDSHLRDISDINKSCFLDDFLKLGYEEDGSVKDIIFEQVSFSHPIVISYTSGTTGLPKALVHGAGVLMAVVNAFSLNIDCDRNSVLLSVSPVGWATWTMFSSLHFTGQTVVIFEGVPFFLSQTYLWDMVDKYKISHVLFPTSAVDELQKRNCVPTNHTLDSLKYTVAVGSVVKHQNFEFMYQILKDVMFVSTFGCTETMGACITSDTTLPVYKGEITCPCLGIALETVDESENAVFGEMGDIVIAKPVPFLPVGLWGDTNGSLYKEKYFPNGSEKFSFRDFAIRNPITKGFIVCCRSDETLKQRGCRFGSSEIYNVVEVFPEIEDSICVSHYNKTLDESAVLFLKIKKGFSYNDQLVERIRDSIAKELTEAHVPDIIIETKEIPYNVNGKKMEIIVKKIINKMPFETGSVINPNCLNNFMNLPELHEF
ncbi:hypothetical protein CDAR_298262 [Caerostris darwini]|uniref:Acetoacetyl-CoA synthetase n=1 Tax=Caerostris darwini TaxID=1538125 RepID=A0AAV4TG46_9ARAC|nr:hypothetical protein CDAR_298262 [Caerostris darwini]